MPDTRSARHRQGPSFQPTTRGYSSAGSGIAFGIRKRRRRWRIWPRVIVRASVGVASGVGFAGSGVGVNVGVGFSVSGFGLNFATNNGDGSSSGFGSGVGSGSGFGLGDSVGVGFGCGSFGFGPGTGSGSGFGGRVGCDCGPGRSIGSFPVLGVGSLLGVVLLVGSFAGVLAGVGAGVLAGIVLPFPVAARFFVASRAASAARRAAAVCSAAAPKRWDGDAPATRLFEVFDLSNASRTNGSRAAAALISERFSSSGMK